ncbi:MAG: hypothetical protein HW402_988 [Dehalococcoidales bacterium]|nr:hypothetical protein [Dehalococcoidales bacterium]
MKTNKISRMLGVGLTVAMLASMLVAIAPVSAGTLSISEESDIKAIKAGEGYKLAPAGLDIASLAVKSKVIYAATGTGVKKTSTEVNALYKSTDTGSTWTTLASTTDFPTTNATDTKAIKLVAVASDDDKVVAIVASDDTAYYSLDGGSSWSNLNQSTAGFVINSIDISVPLVGARYVAAGGTIAGAGVLYTLKLGIGEGWIAQQTNTGFTTGTVNSVNAVKFSPKFATDKIITVVSANTTGPTTDATFQAFRLEKGSERWNGSITTFTDWGTGLKIATIPAAINAASIALPASYLGTSYGDRVAFVGIAAGSGGGVWRVVDNSLNKGAFATYSQGDEGPIGSIAYNNTGKLIAGSYTTNQVFRSLAPMAADPTFDRVKAEKQPGGQNKVQVRYADTTPVAGTAGDESAFATSTDDGSSFNDISLIDTTFAAIDDVAVSADGATVYLASRSGNDASVWLKEGTLWTRVRSLRDYSATPALMIRLAPTDAKVVYVGAKGALTTDRDIWVSQNSGKTTWTSIPAYRVTSLQDFAVLNATTVYALDTDGVSKTTDSGASWGDKKNLDGLTTGYMITLAPNTAGDVLVGTSDGNVAFSKDGGNTFYKTSKPGATGNTQVIADSLYTTNNIIYAFVATEVRRGTAVSTTQTWSSRGPTLPTTYAPWTIGSKTVTWAGYVGAARVGTVIYGIVNGVNADNNTELVTLLYRALKLTAADSEATAEWSYMATAKNMQTVTPQSIKASTPAKFWGSIGSTLYSATDPIAAVAPTVTGPATNAEVQVNPETGKVYNITFTFNRLAGATGLTDAQLQIATDANFSAILDTVTKSGIDTDTTSIVYKGDNLNPGSTYYWRVRFVASTTAAATNQLNTPWSATRTFKTLSTTKFTVMTPEPGAEGVSVNPTFTWAAYAGAVGYELNVSKDPTFETITWIGRRKMTDTFYRAEVALDYSTTYYWRLRAETGPAPAEGVLPPGSAWMRGIFTTQAKPVEATPTVSILPALGDNRYWCSTDYCSDCPHCPDKTGSLNPSRY